MSVYLSIDLDYWKNTRISKYPLEFLAKVMALRVPKVLVLEHDALLTEPCRPKGFEKLINVDYHSDFANYKKNERRYFNCGTWVDEFPDIAEFEWRHPNQHTCFDKCEGRCERLWIRSYDICWKNNKAFSGIRMAHREGLRSLPWKDVSAVGIAVSPDYWDNKSSVNTLGKMLDFLYAKRRLFVNRRNVYKICREAEDMYENRMPGSILPLTIGG